MAAIIAVVPLSVPAQPTSDREQTADQQVQHVLNRLAFGPRPGDVARVRAMGVDAWIERQLAPERIRDDSVAGFLARFRTLGMTGSQLLAAYPPPGQQLARIAAQQRTTPGGSMGGAMGGADTPTPPVDTAMLRRSARESYQFLGELNASRVARAIASERQLEEVLVDFWENHFSVFAGKARTRYFLPEYDARVIRPHAMGRFRDLLGAVAKSPAMLTYLDNWQSVADSGRPTLQPQRRLGPMAQRRLADAAQRNPQLQQFMQRRRGLNENYARELMELHTLGVDGGYTQQDVVEVARALTGWTLTPGAAGGGFVFRPEWHDAGEKVILGTRFPAGRGLDEGERVLDLLARHPSTARFIARKLAVRFVSDVPPETLVERAAATFTRTDGDIREVVRTIVTSPEFFATAAYRAKVKSPFELVASTLRAMNAPVEAAPRAAPLLARLGQPLFGHQAPNGWPETGDAWMNTGAILNRINFGLAAGAGQLPGVRLGQWPAARELATLPHEQQVDGVIRTLLGGAVSADTRQVLLSGTNPLLEAQAPDSTRADADPGFRRPPRAAGLAQTVGLALGAPEFQRR
jgi:uncharacterized protein (DUF1800 family)